MRDFYELTDAGRGRRLRRVAEVALAAYDLDVTRVRLIAQDSNATFRLDTSRGESWALRVGIGGPIAHPEAQVRAEMAWLESIAMETDLDVPRPVRTLDGELLTVVSADGVPEPRNCVVFSWLPGPLMADRLTAENLASFGAFTARLHRHGSSFRPPPGFTAPTYDQPLPFDEPHLLFEEDHGDLMRPRRRRVYGEALEVVTAAIGRLQSAQPMQVLHGDLHMWNVKVYRRRIAAFDFEDLMWGWPVQDLATTLYYFWGEDQFDTSWDAIRRGYETVSPWPDSGGEVARFIAGRTLVIANTVLIQPEWRHEAPAVLERGERRIRAMLQRVG